MIFFLINIFCWLQNPSATKNENSFLKSYAYSYAIENKVNKKTTAIVISRGCGAYQNMYYIETTIFNPRVFPYIPTDFYSKNGYVIISYNTKKITNKEIFSNIEKLIKAEHIILKKELSRTYNPILWRIQCTDNKHIILKNYALTPSDGNYGCK